VKRVAIALPAAMGLVCGTYAVLYLSRWEWNRAIIAGLFFVAIEVIVVGMLLLERLRHLEERVADVIATRPAAPPAIDDGPVREALRETAAPPGDHFAWLRDQAGRTNVFLPVLLGAGVLASALAWAVEHVARATLTPARERRLAVGLGPLRFPAAGLLAEPAPVAALPRRRLRSALVGTTVVAAVVGTGIGTVAAVDYVADRTQTRPDPHVAGVDTIVHLELLGATATRDPQRILGHLWSTCTGPDVFRSRTLPEPTVVHGRGGRVALHVGAHIGEHALARLRGCLNDTTLDRVQARVVHAGPTDR